MDRSSEGGKPHRAGKPSRRSGADRLLHHAHYVMVVPTLLVAAIGLFGLFVDSGHVGRLRGMPGWPLIRDLDELEARIASMLVLVASTSFVELVVDFQGGISLLYLGAGVALLITALTFHTRYGPRSKRTDRETAP